MRDGTLLTFWMLAIVLIAFAFVLRAFAPRNSFLPGGWPLGSHWHHTNQVLFWWFLIQGIAAGIIAVVASVIEKSLANR